MVSIPDCFAKVCVRDVVFAREASEWLVLEDAYGRARFRSLKKSIALSITLFHKRKRERSTQGTFPLPTVSKGRADAAATGGLANVYPEDGSFI